MAEAATLTLTLIPETADKLQRLAESRGTDQRDVAAAALSGYVDHETEIGDRIREGLADLRAGRVVPHEAAMAELRSFVATEDLSG